MRFGVIFPTTEVFAADAGAIKSYAQAVQDLGFVDLWIFDHVLGASDTYYPKSALVGSYRQHHSFREPLVLFGFLAGVAPRLSLSTNVLILPQRQTALVAKQAAEIDILCGGRLTLGIGTGWSPVEYEGLGIPFAQRGARQEEQIALMRELWTKSVVRFEGKFDRIMEAGINPLPIQRPIPIWLGGMAEAVIKRVARLADGWFPMFAGYGGARSTAIPLTGEPPSQIVERMRRYAIEAGRDPARIGLGCRLTFGNQTPEDWSNQLREYRNFGATRVAVNTMAAGLKTIDEHISALRQVAEVIGVRS